jgi:2-C-methyl-D-erythritol 2,4-cyclodiphosphate synthase
MRIGIGYDIHKLVKGRPLVLGGVKVPYAKGLLGHSDADVLLHAICDAILGAAALDDIGKFFPNTDPRYKGISSLKLLRKAGELIASKGYRIVNVDSALVAEEPKIAPFKKAMIRGISAALGVKETDVNIKATTNEGMGDIGKKKAIAAYAVALLENRR